MQIIRITIPELTVTISTDVIPIKGYITDYCIRKIHCVISPIVVAEQSDTAKSSKRTTMNKSTPARIEPQSYPCSGSRLSGNVIMVQWIVDGSYRLIIAVFLPVKDDMFKRLIDSITIASPHCIRDARAKNEPDRSIVTIYINVVCEKDIATIVGRIRH